MITIGRHIGAGMLVNKQTHNDNVFVRLGIPNQSRPWYRQPLTEKADGTAGRKHYIPPAEGTGR
jgi:hypothetical protein